MKGREKLARLDGEDSSPKNFKTLRITGGSRMVIYRGVFDNKENQVKVEVHVDHNAKEENT